MAADSLTRIHSPINRSPLCPQSVRSARRYFAAAAEASDGLNLRALYGVSLCAAFLARVCKGRADAEGSEAGELGALAEKRLLQVCERRRRFSEEQRDAAAVLSCSFVNCVSTPALAYPCAGV